MLTSTKNPLLCRLGLGGVKAAQLSTTNIPWAKLAPPGGQTKWWFLGQDQIWGLSTNVKLHTKLHWILAVVSISHYMYWRWNPLTSTTSRCMIINKLASKMHTVNQLNFAAVKFRGFGPFWVTIGNFPYIIVFNWYVTAKLVKYGWFTVTLSLNVAAILLQLQCNHCESLLFTWTVSNKNNEAASTGTENQR